MITAAIARRLFAAGLDVVPLTAALTPIYPDWDDWRTRQGDSDEENEAVLYHFEPPTSANVGIVLDDTCVLEFASEIEWKTVQSRGLLNTLAQRTPDGRVQAFVRSPRALNAPWAGVRVRGPGGFTVGAGTSTPAGEYAIVHDAPVAEAAGILPSGCGIAGEASPRAAEGRQEASRRDCAVALSRRYGFRVFKLKPDSKLPAAAAFYDVANSDPDAVHAMWTCPVSGDPLTNNVGILTGGGLLVLDIDVRDEKRGLESLTPLVDQGLDTSTLTAITPSGGRHLFFRYPPGVRIAGKANALGPGIDTRGHHNYVVGAGSTLPNGEYEWLDPSAEILDAPDWLVVKLRSAAPALTTASTTPIGEQDTDFAISQGVAWLVDEAPEAVEGEGGDFTTLKVAMRLKDLGVSEPVALDLMLEHWNGEKAVPPWDGEDLAVKVHNAYRYGKHAPGYASAEAEFGEGPLLTPSEGRELLPSPSECGDPIDLWADQSEPPDLPPGLLPAALDRWVSDEAERKGVERGAVALPALVACAAAATSRFEVQVKQHDTGHTDRPILWGALIGPPAARKSPVLKEALRPLKGIEDAWRAHDAEEGRAYEKKRARWEKSGRENGDPEPPRPRRRRKIINDTTVEALGPILRDNPDGVLSFNDELAGWIGAMDAYRPGKSASKDQPFWLSAKQGEAYTIDRATRDSLHVPHAAVHVLGGIQPDVIRKVASDCSGNGLLQRFMLVNLQPASPALDRAPDERASKEFRDAIKQLAGLQYSEFVPRSRFRFTPEADKYRQEIVAFRDKLLNDPDVPIPLQGWLGKIEAEWARLALILHFVKWTADVLADDFPEEFISAETAEQAARLIVEWQYPHQRYFYQSVAGLGANIDADARNVAGLILARGMEVITERDIDRSCSGLRRENRRPARLAAMRTLEINGWVRVSGWHRAYKHPSEWRVNPLVHDGRFKERADAERHRREAIRQKIAVDGAARRECHQVSPSVTSVRERKESEIKKCLQ